MENGVFKSSATLSNSASLSASVIESGVEETSISATSVIQKFETEASMLAISNSNLSKSMTTTMSSSSAQEVLSSAEVEMSSAKTISSSVKKSSTGSSSGEKKNVKSAKSSARNTGKF